jgi:adenylate cyclase
VGLATGPALVGNVGSRSKFNYTAMGDTVNLASRLEGAAKVYGASSLVAGSTVEAAGDVACRELDWLQVKGRSAPVPVHAIVPADEAGDPTFEQLRTCYASGLQAYRARRFAEALRDFDKALATVPGDGPAQEMAARCREFIRTPPPPDWQGAHEMHTK